MSGAGTATGRIRRVGCGNRGMVAEGGIWNESVPFALRRRMVRSRSSTVAEVDAQANVVRVGTIGCFGGGAAVGALFHVPQKFEAAVGTEWIVRAAPAFGTLLGLLCLLAILDYGVIQGISPRAFSTRSLAWPAPVDNGRTIGPVVGTRHESDLRQEVRDLKRAVAELAEAVERVQGRMDMVERRRWWRR